jgi:nitrite reductase/ring-hydroxylating ferredoxin subunit
MATELATKMATGKLISGTAAEIPEALKTGLLNYWYPLTPSQDLGTDKPLGLQRLGEDLVLWRGQGGKPVLFVDRCPHRGALLSEGWIESEGRLSCTYHGLQFDDTGQCRRIPAERKEDGPQTRHFCALSYPCEERAGFIWGYIGDVEKFPPPPLELEPEVEGDEYHVQPWELGYVWEAPWPLVMDNNLDLAHGPFLHWYTAKEYFPENVLDYYTPINSRVEEIDGDIRLGGSRGRHLMFLDDDRQENTQKFFLPHCHRIDVGLGREYPEGSMRLIVYIVPINAERTLYYHHICAKKTLLEKEAWEELFSAGSLQEGLRGVYREDVGITLGQRTTTRARSGEHMLPQDLMVIQVRRLILEAYQVQQGVSSSIQ